MVLKHVFWGLSFLVGISIAFISHAVRAEVLFEGYSKINSGGVHIGYAIIRYDFDAKKKQFIASTFLKTNDFGGNLTESLKAVASEDLKPVSYQYTTLTGKVVKTIDGKVEKGKLVAVVKDGDKSERIVKDLPKGAFFSSFLAYVMLKSPQGFKSDNKYDYEAIAEEDAALYKGVAYVKNLQDYNGLKAFQVLNEFKGTKFISFVSERGEVLSTKSPLQGISTELVAQPTLATAGMTVPAPTLKTLFGEVPTGQKNEVSNKAKAPPPTTPPPAKVTK